VISENISLTVLMVSPVPLFLCEMSHGSSSGSLLTSSKSKVKYRFRTAANFLLYSICKNYHKFNISTTSVHYYTKLRISVLSGAGVLPNSGDFTDCHVAMSDGN
jgi:hypothetical protein